MIQFEEDKQNRRVSDLLKREEEQVIQVLSAKYSLEYVDLSVAPITTDALRLIDEPAAREAKIAAFGIVDKKLKIAVRNPEDEKAIAIVNALREKGYIPTLYVTSSASLEKAWNSYKDLSFASESRAGSLDVSSDEISAIVEKAKGLPTIISILENTLAMKKSYRVSRILETILAGALATNASDVHIEPEEEYIRLRYRLDGVLVNVVNFDKSTYALLLSRIKLLSGLKLNVKKNSQDGRFSVHIGTDDIEIRTSVLPGAYNESIVMRLLNPKSISVSLEDLGIPEKLLGILLKEIDKPNGMILTTGPTGSGKTTTLYAFLKKVHNPQIKIITIEDPIEYHLPGIVQTQVNDKGYTFLEGLRAAVRQDPDIIMVGEIRDNETADIAVNSALTGHLVFSTLHTNDAAGTFPRLIDLGVNPKILPSALTVALAQRLVRRLCPYCKKEAIVEGEAKEIVARVISSIFDKTQVPPEASPKDGAHVTMWEGVGCDRCNNTGYKGRMGIYEGILVNDPAIQKAVDYGSSDREIATAAIPQGILDMKQDGIIKVLKGITSLDELRRVIDLDQQPFISAAEDDTIKESGDAPLPPIEDTPSEMTSASIPTAETPPQI
jgi:type IV pilus assembly protein PilB